MRTLECTNVTSPPVLKLWDSQGYAWLPYDLTKVINLIGERFEPKKYPSALLSFLPYYCHSFRITVIPSTLLSFLPHYCHSFRIIVIRSELVSFLPNIVIPFKLFRELQIPTSSKSFPYPKGEKNGFELETSQPLLSYSGCEGLENFPLPIYIHQADDSFWRASIAKKISRFKDDWANIS